MPTKKETDWKTIAVELLKRVDFAMQNLRPPPGSGTLYNLKTGTMRPWREYFADAVEMVPGVTVDREALHAYDLPPKKRKEFFKNREKNKS